MSGCDETAFGMIPPRERLEAEDLSARHVDLGW